MTQPYSSTCSPWATSGDACAPCNTYDFNTAELDEGMALASDVLFDLTGRRWPGLCDDVLRPCGYRQPGSCGCLDSRQCGCRRLSEVELPGPVDAITQVRIDGAVIDPARYRVDDHRWLVYLPESDSAERQGWPCCQRIDLPATDDDTWEVTYSYGMDPPPGGVRAAAQLGCQLALACSADPSAIEQCQLPERVTTVVRQGITMAVLDPWTLFAGGQTGLADVDLWINSVRIGAKSRQATVFVPGQLGQHRRVGT